MRAQQRRRRSRFLPLSGLTVTLATTLAAGLSLTACQSAAPAQSTAVPSQALGSSSSPATPTVTGSTGRPPGSPTASPTTSAKPSSAAAQPSATGAASGPAPTAYTTVVVHRGTDHPDDLVLDPAGALVYSDYTNGTISRLNADGSATILYRGLAGPEGLVYLADGTLIVAEEKTNRVLSLAPGKTTPTVLRTLPGAPTLLTCHEGVDGIAWDPVKKLLVVPDAVTGVIYEMSTDGRTLTTISSGFTHPVGAAVDASGRVYVADECGGNVWRLGAGGSHIKVASALMPDDVVLDGHGNVLVTDVRHIRHDVRRWPLAGGSSLLLAETGLIEPQGLLVDPAGRIYISDDKANVILRLTPVS